MVHPELTREEIAQRAKKLYQQCLRTQVKPVDNVGKITAIDLDTGAYEIGRDLIVACDHLKVQHPNAVTWAARVRYNAVCAIGEHWSGRQMRLMCRVGAHSIGHRERSVREGREDVHLVHGTVIMNNCEN